jgi:cytochrome P450
MATAVRQPEVRPSRDRHEYRFPPGFQRNLLWFALRKLRPANPILLFQHLAETYGDIAHYKIGPHHIVFLNHPEYIREVLVVQNDNFIKERTVQRTRMLLGEGMITSEGAVHRAQRLAAQPAFHRQRIGEYAAIMVEEAARIRDSWRAGERRDIAADMMHLTLNVVARTLFATDCARKFMSLRRRSTASWVSTIFWSCCPQRNGWCICVRRVWPHSSERANESTPWSIG